MKNETAYHTAIEILNRDVGRLFQRLNFFLIATGFFVAAFATILTTTGASSRLLYFDYFVASAGLMYSLAYSVIMNHNARIIFQIGEYIRQLEVSDFTLPVAHGLEPHIRINQIVHDAVNHGLLKNWLADIRDSVVNRSRLADRTVGDHTYAVPLLFAAVWASLLVFLSLFHAGCISF